LRKYSLNKYSFDTYFPEFVIRNSINKFEFQYFMPSFGLTS